MCKHDSKTPVNPVQSSGSLRRRLWDLSDRSHCPVIGICVPIDVLRKLVKKTVGNEIAGEDFVVHTSVVSDCGRRSRLTEMLQTELERRFAQAIKSFKVAKTTEDLALLWKQVFEKGDIAGALWAGLTHPRCDAHMEELILRNIHMYQHYAVEMLLADAMDLDTLAKENAVLTRELGKVQERSTRLLSDKNGEIERLNAQLMQLRAENIGKDSRIALLSQELATLKGSVNGYQNATRLQKKTAQMTARQAELEAESAELRRKLAAATKSLDALSGESATLAKAADMPVPPAPQLSPVTFHMNKKNVLCVGGRSGNIANYRDLIERVGGRFAHHDGGQEERQNVLDASLVAADLVICQTGCISHNAYWKVKDFCKRTGKRCVFVDNPSSSSLIRSLKQMSVNDRLVQEENLNSLQPGLECRAATSSPYIPRQNRL
jgi:hypothetical protein